MNKSTLKEIIKQCISETYLDRHGSLPDRPKEVRFTGDTGEEDYNNHMGFDAAISDDVVLTEKQKQAIIMSKKEGYKITGHSNWMERGPNGEKYIEVLMTKRTNTGSRYRDINPYGDF